MRINPDGGPKPLTMRNRSTPKDGHNRPAAPRLLQNATGRLRSSRLQDVSDEAEESGQTGAGSSDDVVGSTSEGGDRGGVGTGASGLHGLDNAAVGGADGVVRGSGGDGNNRGGGSGADGGQAGVDGLGQGARALGDGQGGGLGDGVGLSTDGENGGGRAHGGVVDVGLGDIAGRESGRAVVTVAVVGGSGGHKGSGGGDDGETHLVDIKYLRGKGKWVGSGKGEGVD